jgi:hypothetical protein
MEQCSTLVYIIDNLSKPLEECVNICQLFDEVDTSLDKIFKGAEIEVGPDLVSKTLAKIRALV